MNGGLGRAVLGAAMVTMVGCGGQVEIPDSPPQPRPPIEEEFHIPPQHDPPLAEPPLTMKPAPPKCRSATLDPNGRAANVVLSSDRLVASVTAYSVNDSVRGDVGLDHGKAYFEVTVTKSSGDTYNGIGIATDKVPLEVGFGFDSESCGYDRRGGVACGDLSLPDPGARFAEYGTGSTIGVAVDLDAGRVWFSVDGQWQGGGGPGSSDAGRSIGVSAGRLYYPYINISQGDVYTANFGNTPFLHAAPNGFASGWGNECTRGSSLSPNKCVSLVDGKIATIDLTTGQTTMGPAVASSFGPDISSLGVFGDDLVFCDEGKVVRASLRDGTTTPTQTACDAVTADANGIWILTIGGKLTLYEDFAAVAANGPSQVVSTSIHASRLGASPDGVLAAWHSTNELTRAKVDGTTSMLSLEGYDGWVFGVSAATGGRIIVSSPVGLGGQGALVAFDAATGKNLGVVAKASAVGPVGFNGIACGF